MVHMPHPDSAYRQAHDKPRGLRLSLRTRMVLIFGCLFLATLAANLLTFKHGIPFTRYDGEYSHAIEDTLRKLGSQASSIKYRLLDWMDERKEDLMFISQSPLMISTLDSLEPLTIKEPEAKSLMQRPEYLDLTRHLQLLLAKCPSYQEAMLIRSSTDKIVASSDPQMVGSIVIHYHPTKNPPILFEEWFYVEKVKASPGEDAPLKEYIVGTYPVSTINGSMRDYSLVARMSLEEEALPRAGDTIGDEELIIFDSGLNILYHSTFDEPAMLSGVMEAIKSMMPRGSASTLEGIAETVASREFKGLPFIAAYENVELAPNLSIGVMLVKSKAVVLDGIRNQEHRAAAVGMVTMLAALALTAAIANRLTRPVRRLSRTAASIRSGDLSARAETEGPDEISELAMTFNSMLDNIRSWQDDLENRIRQRTEEIRKSEQHFMSLWEEFVALLNAIPEPLIFLDPDLSARWANKSAAAMRKGKGDQPVSVIPHCYEMLFGRSQPCENCPALECFRTAVPMNIQTSSDDGRIWDLRIMPVIEDGKVIRVIEHAIDITQSVSSQAERIKSARLASIGSLAAGIAHEVNNPINGIINYAQIMLDEARRREGADTEMPERIIREGRRIESIVKGLLNFSRQRDEHREFDAQGMLDDTICLVRLQLVKEGIAIESIVPDGLPHMLGNMQQIQQVALNIIQNSRHALNALRDDQPRRKLITIVTEDVTAGGRRYVRFRFRDNGIGIPPQMLDKVMTPFFTTKPSGEGTGLGLSISHEIISRHGGNMDIISEEGQFTEITIDIPAASGPDRR